MVASHHSLRAIVLVVHEEPSRRLRKDPDKGDNDAGAKKLQPDRDKPCRVSGKIERCANCTTGYNGPSEPFDLVSNFKASKPQSLKASKDRGSETTKGRYLPECVI